MIHTHLTKMKKSIFLGPSLEKSWGMNTHEPNTELGASYQVRDTNPPVVKQWLTIPPNKMCLLKASPATSANELPGHSKGSLVLGWEHDGNIWALGNWDNQPICCDKEHDIFQSLITQVGCQSTSTLVPGIETDNSCGHAGIREPESWAQKYRYYHFKWPHFHGSVTTS